jgi:prolactin regulatory element-binding protein
MRARHTAHSTPTFPVYSAAFLSPGELILGGGGGASKTGIKNKLVRHPTAEHVTLRNICLVRRDSIMSMNISL